MKLKALPLFDADIDSIEYAIDVITMLDNLADRNYNRIEELENEILYLRGVIDDHPKH